MLSFVARQCYNKPVQGINSVDVWQNRIIVFGALRWRWQFPEQDSQTPTEGFVMSKEIPLTKNRVTIVDDEDYEYLMQWKWHCDGKGYAKRRTKKGEHNRSEATSLHRVVVERMTGITIPLGYEVDHINMDPLDNRRGNLRLATRSQNAANMKRLTGSTSVYKGVYKIKGYNKWGAAVAHHGKSFWVGSFNTEEDAARAYDVKAKELFGEFARLNFPKKTEEP